MSRRFRMTLFLCLSAATGLHLRPCIGTLRGGCDPQPSVTPGDSLESAFVVAERGARPSLGDLSTPPTLVGLEAAVAEAR